MKRRMIAIALLLLAGLCGTATQAERQTTAVKTDASNYTLSGPYSHKNLTIFLIHGKDQRLGKAPLTLQEAMAQKKVVVRETGDVNNLTIQNRSREEVFVQAGDIVKGGQQDRVLALDLILPPNSGRIPIDAFCVEHSRWNQRGNEAVSAFSSSDKALATKGLKLAARNSRSQQEVWENVGVAQNKLARNYAAAKGLPGGVATGAGVGLGEGRGSGSGRQLFGQRAQTPQSIIAADRAGDHARISGGVLNAGNAALVTVTSQASPTSLQLTLENKNVRESSGEYVKQLGPIITGKKDVIGYVFAINNQMNSADVYSSTALFRKLWPKLLDASAVEAFAELDQAAESEPVTADIAQAFLRDADSGKPETKNLRPRTKMMKRETEKNLLFEARDRTRGDAWVHRNYLAK